MSSPKSPKTRLRLSSIVNIDSSSHYQKIVNHNTGETRIFDKPAPHSIKKRDTVTTNPLEYTTSKPKKPSPNDTPKPDQGSTTGGFDSSELNK